MTRSNRIKSAVLSSVKRLREFGRCEDGAAIVEFALVLPVFMTLTAMFAIGSRGNVLSNQVQQTAATVSDVISQSSSISVNDIDAAMRAGEAVAGTQTAGQVKLGVIGVRVSSGGQSEVMWTRTLHGATVPAVGSTNYPLPNGLLSEPGFIVVAEASMDYVPVVGYAITGAIPFSSKHYFVPRNSSETACPACNP